MGDYITTYTGKHFYPLNPNADALFIEDIAHSLSLVCRGNGHVHCFYSVAEHCVNCALEADARGYSRRVVLGCLLHDASESYMSDVPSPFKKYLKDYLEMEEKVMHCIYQTFLGTELTDEEQAQIDQIDKDALAHDLFWLLHEGMQEDLPELKRPYSYGKDTPHEVEVNYLELYRKYAEVTR